MSLRLIDTTSASTVIPLWANETSTDNPALADNLILTGQHLFATASTPSAFIG